MKILYVVTGLGVGGAERQVLDLADRFGIQGHEVKICYLTGPALLRPMLNSIELIPLNLKKTIPGFMLGIINLGKIIKNFAPDVVHAHMVHANLFTRIIRPFCSIKKLINTAHNTNEGGRARMLAYRLTHSLADVTTNVTLEAVRVFEQKKACPIGGMQAMPNGIDTDIFKPDLLARNAIRASEHIGQDEKLVVAVGRLVDAKDYDNLLMAFSKLCEKRSKVKLWIVGDGPERDKLENLVKLLGLSGDVRFLGVRSDVNNIYNAADLYTLSSAWEGFGLVVAEAMATEKVVVATDCGGVKEVLGGCGYLVPRKDPSSLMQAMSTALDLDPEDSRKLSISARDRIVKNYSINEIVDVWARIYKY
ncbi:glycosyltransferase [Pseudomonas sp. CCC3.1]|uniref:glycosyltransferase n=1 Tax=Pseudomonas sp. CCC3.1 TaxID=3048607 RepID=UPI002AC8BB47|nr:glycosyltransferase [Pseudomonas sp. CCC3.1]MEB0203938.1 glycosyltransferase [Pseudomonas sp. CCC3.1]WPX37767.1 glycosyltransferase [Pseudomonas sp. CCC3.1]